MWEKFRKSSIYIINPLKSKFKDNLLSKLKHFEIIGNQDIEDLNLDNLVAFSRFGLMKIGLEKIIPSTKPFPTNYYGLSWIEKNEKEIMISLTNIQKSEKFKINSEQFELIFSESPLIQSEETFNFENFTDNLLSEKIKFFKISKNGEIQTKLEEGSIILPGSFNPLHEGHEKLLETCGKQKEMINKKLNFELSVFNADKGSISKELILRRLIQFYNHEIILSNAPLYAQKAILFPNSIFVIGYDTAIRILNQKYYGIGRFEDFKEAMSIFTVQKNQFYVAGRTLNDKWMDPRDLEIPEICKTLFFPLDFRFDISSTELRKKL